MIWQFRLNLGVWAVNLKEWEENAVRLSFLAVLLLGAIAVILWLLGSGFSFSRGEQKNVSYAGVYGPPSEPNFEEKFNVTLDLPMDEEEFLSLIDGLGVEYVSSGPTSLNLKNTHPGFIYPLVPKHRSDYDMSLISHSYTIYGGRNEAKRRYEDYLALIRNDRMVVYVENFFAYDPY